MAVPVISTPTLRFFRRIVRGYMRRHFHAVRLSGAELFKHAGRAGAEPLMVYANHSSWWDPMVAILLAAELMPQRRHYAPMDAAALERYGILKKAGIFPVEMKTARGAAQFLRIGQAVLREGGVLWVTPQGKFVDARVRPIEFKPGLAALAVRGGPCTVLPLAIEYPFWDERLPECLLRFGEPVRVGAGADAEQVQQQLVRALETTMNQLQRMAAGRSAAEFETLARGTAGAGGFYALGQRIKALLRGRPYRADHTLAASIEAGALSSTVETTGGGKDA